MVVNLPFTRGVVTRERIVCSWALLALGTVERKVTFEPYLEKGMVTYRGSARDVRDVCLWRCNQDSTS
jgi:hypothetical protein